MAPASHSTISHDRTKSPAAREEELGEKYRIEIGPHPDKPGTHFTHHMLDCLEEVLGYLPKEHTRYNGKLKAIYPLPGDEVNGYYSPSTNIIELRQRADYGAKQALRHEIGHAVSEMIGWENEHKRKAKFGNWRAHNSGDERSSRRSYVQDRNGQWWSYYTSHREVCFVSNYQWTDPGEYFAEVYAAYYDPNQYSRRQLSSSVLKWFETRLPALVA
ncbi:MAG: hypothetical protein JO362_08155 [Streptomycetaceae bacterium]|nr:hypothetical protein [Streptomycetaceae bacterium]